MALTKMQTKQLPVVTTLADPGVDTNIPSEKAVRDALSGFVTTHDILSATHSDALTGSVVDGSLIIGNVTPKWSALEIAVPAANVRNVLGIDNGETRPSWKAALDATSPTTLTAAGAAAAGTSLMFSHRDHVHPITGMTNKATVFRNEAFVRFISPMLEALTWAAAQIYQAAVTFQSTISQAVTSSGAGATYNQSGTGDIAAFQDAGVARARVPDQGGIVLVPQAGGYQNIVGLVGYDNVKKRLVLYHESHNFPVPIDPRNGFRNEQFRITY